MFSPLRKQRQIDHLQQCFPALNVHQYILGILLNIRDSDSPELKNNDDYIKIIITKSSDALVPEIFNSISSLSLKVYLVKLQIEEESHATCPNFENHSFVAQ